MSKTAIAAILFVEISTCTHTLAAENLDLSKCSEIKGNVERLQCFDDLTGARGASSPVESAASKGDWQVQTETSKINDSTNVQISIDSKEPIVGRYGEGGRAQIWIACREGKTDVLFSFADHFLADIEGYGDLTVRVDKRPSAKLSATESTDHKALGLWNGTGLKFIRSLYGASNLLVRVTPYSESAITTEFNVAGLREVIQPLAKACHWPEKSAAAN